MNDYFLKFTDEAAFNDVMPSAVPGVLDIDVVGEIPDHEGFHVNVRCAEGLPDTLASFVLDPPPVTPYRVFAP